MKDDLYQADDNLGEEADLDDELEEEGAEKETAEPDDDLIDEESEE